MADIHIALVHHPVINKVGEVVSTAVTNLDIHDNARSARTYGLSGYHLITPLDAQIALVSRILEHWQNGFGARRVPTRVEAMNLVSVNRSLEGVIAEMTEKYGRKPYIISTCARKRETPPLGYQEARDLLASESCPFLILFGTGYGLAEDVFDASDAVLPPIGNPGDWNHLSVRSAVAITLDRLLGDKS